MKNNSVFGIFVFRSFSSSPLFVNNLLNMKNFGFHKSFSNLIMSNSQTICRLGVFSKFLSPVLIFNGKSEYRLYSIVSNQVVRFGNCNFMDIISQSSLGGALCCNNCDLSIISCKFQNCRSNLQGGAFALNRNTLTLNRSCFYICSCTKTNENGGNVFICSNSNTTIYNNHAFLCAPVKDTGGDSLFDISQNHSTINSWNTTQCNGVLGSTGGNYYSVIEGSSHSYSLVYNSSDHNSFGAWYSRVLIFKTNFLHNYRNSHCFVWGNSNPSMLFKECVFFNNIKALTSSNSFSFENCISDYGYASISTQSEIATIVISQMDYCLETFDNANYCSPRNIAILRIPIVLMLSIFIS